MFLVDILNIVYTSMFLIVFCISYFVIIAMRTEVLFKKASVWQIRIFQVLIALALSYLVTQGLFSLVKSF